jgi:hypothetical protein
MKDGDTIYRASRWLGDVNFPPTSYVFEGTVTETVAKDGMVKQWASTRTGAMDPLDGWRATRIEALQDAHRNYVRYIGLMQAKADELAATILAAELMTVA